MSLQDIPINQATETCVMFDNGSELTLVSSFFTKKNKFPYKEATYTLSGVGTSATTYKDGEGGRIYTVPLKTSTGETISVKAFSVKSILTGKIGREEIVFNPKEFPHLSVETLKEAGKALPCKYLDLLVCNPDLGIQPVRNLGFGCLDCSKGHCLY